LGQKIDISMCDGALAWAMLEAAEWFAAGIRTRRGSRVNTGALACATTYACREGGWIALAAIEPKFWEAFCQGVARPDLLAHHHDPIGSPTHGELQTIFAARTRAEWTSFAEQNDCCLEPVLELEEVLESAAVRERGMLVQMQQPGAAPVSMLGSPLNFDRTPARPASSAPVLGADTAAILRELGFNDQQVQGLIDQGAVAASADG
jgi:crotonobetainyl-CoA:carnitine CoA-transferase CaiB-like acyl-CoA transferase